MGWFWKVLLSCVGVLGGGLLFSLVFSLATRSKRHELEEVAKIELAELDLREENMGLSFLGGGRFKRDDRRAKVMREATDSGRELKTLEEAGKWVFLLGVLVAIIGVVVWWEMC
ncbi:hypothetical protein IIZ77_01425 [Candidatus Saccharibacteria bacterium]|nr:hypothetical protein [Candidatus Saccharibacteria bacterium]